MPDASATSCTRCGSAFAARAPGVCPVCAGRAMFSSWGDADLAEDEDFESASAPRTLGEYDLLEELGRGAMGVVYRARHRRLGREAALKVILSGQFASGAERRRFLVEAESAARLDHPYLVALYEQGEDGGRLFQAMQYIAGPTLAARLREGAMAPRAAAELVAKCARAVQHAHERAVLHRDLKPGNVLLDAAGEPHVADFGLARRSDRDASLALTLAGSPIGTPGYMAPELAAGAVATAAADIWSLGAVLYEALSGAPPFTGATIADVLLALKQADPARLLGRVPGVDRDLESICLRCLEKEPARRYGSALALAEDLECWARGEAVTARSVTRLERMCKWAARHPAIAGLGALAVLLFLGGLSGIVWQWRRANREADSARQALQQAEETLWRANGDRAHALRISRAPGQRLQALEAIRAAAHFRPTRELRDEAIAALALPDVGAELVSRPLPADETDFCGDADLESIAYRSAGRIHCVRLADGVEWASLSVPGVDVHGLCLSENLSRLLYLDGTKAIVCDVPTGAPRLELAETAAATLTADGTRLYRASTDGLLECYDLEHGERLARIEWKDEVSGLREDPSGRQLAVWGARSVWVVSAPDFGSGRRATMANSIFRVAWHPQDGTLFAGVEDGTLVQFSPGERGSRVVARHDREGVTPYPHPGGLIVASTSWDGIARFHSAPWGELLRLPSVRPVGFSRDGRRLLVLRDRRAVVLSFVPPERWRPLPAQPELLDCYRFAFSPDSRWLLVAHGSALLVWEVATQRLAARLPLHEVVQAGFAPSGILHVVTWGEGFCRLPMEVHGDTVSLGPLTSLAPMPAGQSALFAFLSKDRVALGGKLGIYEYPGARSVQLFTSNPWLANLTASPDGKWIGAGCWINNNQPGSFAGVWSPNRAEPVAKLPARNSSIYFSPDSRSVIVGEVNEYREYECGTWRLLRQWPRSSAGLDSPGAAWTPDGRTLALFIDEYTPDLLDVATQAELARLATPTPRKHGMIAFSPDGHWLAAMATGAVQLWDVQGLRGDLKELGLGW